jgi:GTP-binding protein
MKKLPTIAIIGRPNVGKSSLFNRILGRRAAVVSNREGVTRDRHFQSIEWNQIPFEIIDTGGFLLDDDVDEMAEYVRMQINTAMEEADRILFLTDARVGITQSDLHFARIVRRYADKTTLVVNKSEKKEDRNQSYDFYQLGLGDPLTVSAKTGYAIADMLDKITKDFPKMDEDWEAPVDDSVRIAILGRPNAGKSTLLNHILGEERQIISDVPGTTRDSIDCHVKHYGKKFVITDTAGLRKKARVNDEVEYFSNMRSLESIRRSDVCVVVIDATRGLGVQDLRIIEQIRDNNKGMIVLLNKWDLIEKGDKSFDHIVKEMKEKAIDLEHIPIVSISAQTGQRTHKIIDMLLEVYNNCFTVLGRDAVVEIFNKAIIDNPHPARASKPILMTRACQTIVNPVVVGIEVNFPELVDESWKRYFLRRLRKDFPLSGAPLKLNLDKKLSLRKDEELERIT